MTHDNARGERERNDVLLGKRVHSHDRSEGAEKEHTLLFTFPYYTSYIRRHGRLGLHVGERGAGTIEEVENSSSNSQNDKQDHRVL